MRVTNRDIQFALSAVNSYFNNNVYCIGYYKVNGYYNLCYHYYNTGCREIRCGLTKKELYNILYATADILYTLKFKGGKNEK